MYLQLRLILVALVVLGTAPDMIAQSAPFDRQRLTQVAQDYVDNKSFMGVVLVAEGDSIALKAAYGYADLDWSIPNTVDTKFRIRSLTKQFTAVGVLLLRERGKLSLSEPIKTYLPDVPDAWSKVTVDNLLTHTSGIPNFTGAQGFSAYEHQSHGPEESVALVRDKPLDFEPGAKFYCSNTNYILLGEIIERVSGMPFARFLRQSIFIPAGMTETGVEVDSAILPEGAQGYDSTPDGFMRAQPISMTVPFSAGSLYSTTGDLLKWERALFAGKIVTAASLRSVTTAKLGEYGMGIFIRTADGRSLITHDGTIEGFESSLNYYPERQLTIVVLGNVRTDAPQRMAAQLGKVAFGEKFTLNSDRRVVEVAPSVLGEYAGHYSVPPFSTTLSVESGHLIATSPNGTKYTLYAQSLSYFFLREIDVQIQFIRDSGSGKVTGFTMSQDGHVKEVKGDSQ